MYTFTDAEIVRGWLRDSKSFGITDHGFVVLFEDRRWEMQGCDVPVGLQNKLKGRNYHNLPLPTYVSLSPTESNYYYIKFADGKSQWVGPSDMDDAIHSRPSVRRVVFGSGDSFVIIYGDGSILSNGVSSSLRGFIKSSKKPMKELSIDQYGDWVAVHYDETTCVANGCTIRDRIKSKERSGFVIRNVVFGPDNNYVIRYSKK